MLSRLITVAFAAALIGCGGSSDTVPPADASVAPDAQPYVPPFDPVAQNCPGGVPPASCTGGHGWMDCGGTGDPLMACNDTGCAWFSGGCVRDGWEPSFCPAGDPFCETSADGPWAFGSDWFPAGPSLNDSVCHPMDMIGDEVITATSNLNVTVTIDPAVEPATEVSVACDGTSLWMCRVPSPVTVTNRGALRFDKGPSAPLLTETVVVEMRENDGALAARALVYYADDVATSSRACARWPDRPRYDGGELVIDDPDAEVPHGSLVLDDAAGGQVTFAF